MPNILFKSEPNDINNINKNIYTLKFKVLKKKHESFYEDYIAPIFRKSKNCHLLEFHVLKKQKVFRI